MKKVKTIRVVAAAALLAGVLTVSAGPAGGQTSAAELAAPTVLWVKASTHADGTGVISLRARLGTVDPQASYWLVHMGVQIKEATTAAWPARTAANSLPSGVAQFDFMQLVNDETTYNFKGLKLCTIYDVRVHSNDNSSAPRGNSSATYSIPTPCLEVPAGHLEQAAKPGMHVEGAGLRHLILEGGSFTYGIRLSHRPTGTLIIGQDPVGDHGGLLTLGSGVTFTPDDWQGIKSTTVTAPDDEVCKNPYTPALDMEFRPLFDPQGMPIWANQRYLVNHQYRSASDNFVQTRKQERNQWRNWSAITFEILDDDCVGVVYSVDEVTVPEGATATFTMRLSQPPDVNSVYLYQSTSIGSAVGTIEPFAATFTKDNWWKPVTFTVTGADDQDADDETGTLVFGSTVSTGSQWHNFNSDPLTIKVIDDETTSPQVAPQRGRIRNPNAEPAPSSDPAPQPASQPDSAPRPDPVSRPGQAPPPQQAAPQQPAPQPEPEPESAPEGTEDAGEPWRAYDTDASGCIESAEWLTAVHDYAAAELDTATVLAVTHNRC